MPPSVTDVEVVVRRNHVLLWTPFACRQCITSLPGQLQQLRGSRLSWFFDFHVIDAKLSNGQRSNGSVAGTRFGAIEGSHTSQVGTAAFVLDTRVGIQKIVFLRSIYNPLLGIFEFLHGLGR